MNKDTYIKIISSEEDMEIFWDLRDGYLHRDIFPKDSLGLPLDQGDREYLLSDDYKSHLLDLSKRSVDSLKFGFFIRKDEIVGFVSYCSYLSEDGKCFIIDYCILEAYRNERLGQHYFELLRLMEVENGSKYFALNVSNRSNMKFWMNCGFGFAGLDNYGLVSLVRANDKLCLIDLDESHLDSIEKLDLAFKDGQYVANPMRILARTYLYRRHEARAFGIYGSKLLGLVMLRSIDEEPAVYEIQEFFIHRDYQSNGYGSEALKLVLDYFSLFMKYNLVEVAVKMDNYKAIGLYKKLGFVESSYVDKDNNMFSLIFDLNEI